MRSTVRAIIILLAISVGVAAILARGSLDRTEENAPLPNENYRIPTERPPVEPDRPDLFEEQGRPQDTR